MMRSTLTRHLPGAARTSAAIAVFALALAAPLATLALPTHSGPASRQQPAPIERRPPPPSTPPASSSLSPQPSPPQQSNNGFNNAKPAYRQHLAEWMQSHRNLTLDQQQRALDAEPGFRQLQPEVQLRMHQRLAQLNSLAPAQRERVFARTEAMERLTNPQRQQVRGALGELGALPEDRRRAVARTFRALRNAPEPQRQVYLNSPQFRTQFTDHERATLNNLFSVAPFLPPPTPQPPALAIPPR